jgi:hypothetical protein
MPSRRRGSHEDDDTPCETQAVFTGCEAVDAYLSIVWDCLVPAAVNRLCPILVWHWWFLAFFLDFAGDAWFTYATLVLRRDELAAFASPAAAFAMIIISSISVVLSLAVLCVRWLRLRPLMAGIEWRYPKNEVLEDGDSRKVPRTLARTHARHSHICPSPQHTQPMMRYADTYMSCRRSRRTERHIA